MIEHGWTAGSRTSGSDVDHALDGLKERASDARVRPLVGATTAHKPWPHGRSILTHAAPHSVPAMSG